MSYHDRMRAHDCAVLGLCLFVAGCGRHVDPYGLKPGPVQEWARKQPDPTIAEGHAGEEIALLSNAFAFKLFAAVDKPGENICISPLGITMSLAMMANGANGSTQKLILDTLGDKGGLRPLNEGMRDLMVVLHSAPNGPITMSNSIWTAADAKPTSAFSNAMEKVYCATVTGGQRNADLLNKSVSNSTNGLIDHVIDSFPSNGAVVVSANVFQSAWQAEFDPRETKPFDFYVAERQSVSTPFMHLDDHEFEYADDDKGEFVLLPYRNPDFAMMVILTPRSDSLTPEQFLERQTWDSWGEMLGNLYKRHCEIRIPRWTTHSRIDLAASLPKLGLGDLLKKADLSNIDPSLTNVPVAASSQSTFLDVNEHGTRGASATVVSTDTGGGRFLANRPFAYAIIHKPTGAILFLGVCNDPTKG